MGLSHFRLRFPINEIARWADRYSYADDAEVERIGKEAGSRGWYTRDELIKVARWKTRGRSEWRCKLNTAADVRRATARALATDDEGERTFSSACMACSSRRRRCFSTSHDRACRRRSARSPGTGMARVGPRLCHARATGRSLRITLPLARLGAVAAAMIPALPAAHLGADRVERAGVSSIGCGHESRRHGRIAGRRQAHPALVLRRAVSAGHPQ